MSKIKVYNSLMLLAGTRVILEKKNPFPIGDRYQGTASFCDVLVERDMHFEPAFLVDILLTDKKTSESLSIKLAKTASNLPSCDLVGEMAKMSRTQLLTFLQRNDEFLLSRILGRKYCLVYGDKNLSGNISSAIIDEAKTLIKQR